MILEVRGVSKSFGGLVAVKNVDLEVKEKEVLGIIGPNGAGKTTLFNLITGFLRPDQGRIIFNGEDITGLKPHEICRRGIARTFQLVKPFPTMTVMENTMIGALLRTKTKAEAEELALRTLEWVQLLDKKDVQARSLTEVDRKRMELARALATRPKLILLDELMSGLNPVEMGEMENLVRDIKAKGITPVVVEHVIKAVMAISDRIVVLNEGMKIAEGTPTDIANNEKVIEVYLGREWAKYAEVK
jgi:branched-chain amino acid transport system ATP-binding protein